jgi:hypothetical protein
MTTPAIASVPVRSAAELTIRWRTLLEPPTFRARSLWLAWFDSDGRQSPVVVPVDDLPESPDPSIYAGLRGLNAAVAESQGSGCHIAMALCRPGNATVRDSDDAWVAALEEVFDGLAEQTWSLHLAAGGRVLPLVEPDKAWRAEAQP